MSLDVRKVVVGQNVYRIEVVLHAERRRNVSVVNMSSVEREKIMDKVIAELSTEILAEVKKKHDLVEVRETAKVSTPPETPTVRSNSNP